MFSSTPTLSQTITVDPNLLEQRRQIAVQLAQQFEVLLQQFGAERVIPFGSVLGNSPWHWNSDLDLAVVGMSQTQWLEAYEHLIAITPNWLHLDLVRLENVSSQVKARILQDPPMPNHPYLLLKEQLTDELSALDQTAIELETAVEQTPTIPENLATRALASYIVDFYKRCERMSERVAVALDGGLPQGQNWHQALLRQVADSGQADRPPLWSGSLLLDLDEYRKFRHVVHHKYGNELKLDYVVRLANLAASMQVKLHQDIDRFSHWLVQQAND